MLLSLLLALVPFATAVASPHLTSFHKRKITFPDPTVCGKIVAAVNDGATEFYASDVYECLVSVPFNADVALRFISYYNTTLQFQSTTAFLKNPPKGYKQPAVDVFARLQLIKANVKSGFYQNQYDFEADVQKVVYEMHDGHTDLSAGILSAFSFASPYYISSASKDGKAAPQLYFTGDIIQSHTEQWKPSPIVTINGYNATAYLMNFASMQSVGTLEPHADWNQLMSSPAQDIQGGINIFSGGATFYPGDALNFQLKNGSQYNTSWLATFDYPDEVPGSIQTPLEFYNFFVLGEQPPAATKLKPRAARTSSSAAASTSTSGGIGDLIMKGITPSETTAPVPEAKVPEAEASETETPDTETPDTKVPDIQPSPARRNWNEVSAGAYPDNPDIVQPELLVTAGGILTAYFFEDISTGIISIPSFNQYGVHLESFAQTIGDFIDGGKAKNLSRIVIDLQQNEGGSVLLALTAFKQFFPGIDPFGGSRRRSHRAGNILGRSINGWWDWLDINDKVHQSWRYRYADSEWVVTDRVNTRTGKNFTSWGQYYGPRRYNGDNFSLTERYDLENLYFDRAAFDALVPYGFALTKKKEIAVQPWKAEDIVILTDGICSSSCALFVEMMTRQAGVRTVVMGGSPIPGKMQAVSGSRGAIRYDADTLDEDFSFARKVDKAANRTLPAVRDPGILVNYAPINLRDQVRNNESVPLQFQYLPANCRLYFTLANTYNMSALWRDVVNATWHHPSKCVKGSRGNSTLPDKSKSNYPIGTPKPHKGTWLSGGDDIVDSDGGLQAGDSPDDGEDAEACDARKRCKGGKKCTMFNVKCDRRQTRKIKACLAPCVSGRYCKGSTQCRYQGVLQSKMNGLGKPTIVSPQGKQRVKYEGLCYPTKPDPNLGCPFDSVQAVAWPDNEVDYDDISA